MSDHNLAEALRQIIYQAERGTLARCEQLARDALASIYEAEQQAGEAVAYAVYWGMPPTRKNSVHFDRETAEDVAAHIKSPTEVRPLFTHPQQPLTEAQAIRMWHENAEAHRRDSAFEWFAAGIIAGERAHGITKDTK